MPANNPQHRIISFARTNIAGDVQSALTRLEPYAATLTSHSGVSARVRELFTLTRSEREHYAGDLGGSELEKLLAELQAAESSVRQTEVARAVEAVAMKAGGATETPNGTAGDEGAKVAALKEPSSDAFKAYRACRILGKTQTEAAELLHTNQGQISRWVNEVAAWLEAGNILPDMPELAAKPVSVDPSVLEMGEREDHLTKRQRPSKSDDDDNDDE